MAGYRRGLCVAVLAVLACSAWGAEDVKCLAQANLMITVTGGGKCWGRVSSHCEAFAKSVSQFRDAYADWFGGDFEGNVCNSGSREAAATAIAKAISEVYTSAYTSIKCSKRVQGSACGWSHGDGTAWALATADAVAVAYADAGGDSTKGVCLSDIRAVAGVVSDTASRSLSDGCVNGGGSAFQWSQSHQRSIQEAVASAFAKATAEVCKKGYYESSATADCEGDASSVVTGDTSGSFTDGDGEGYAQGGGVPDCRDGVKARCCNQAYRVPTCRCDTSLGCENGQYSMTSDYGENNLRSWVSPSGKKCICVL